MWANFRFQLSFRKTLLFSIFGVSNNFGISEVKYNTLDKMSKANGATPPQYTYVPPPSAPPSYQEAVGGVKPVGPFTPIAAPTAPSVNNAIVTTVVPIARTATHMICPSCHVEIETTTRTEPGMIAYLSGFIIALLGCWLGCCLIPCCIDDCMDVHHTCPNCKAYLGRYRR